MTLEFLFWIYLINAILLITREIDSAYWREWELVGLPGGISGFLALHFPILFLILYGLVCIERQSFFCNHLLDVGVNKISDLTQFISIHEGHE